ncbi:DMT family transporter [Nocardioides insulae]|uniref:DMT family transporter n=1 Tax=Nocardioides insulae TaxID=394734 RepID=UPI000421988C|nr:EamA family transporter [Nocardioides insulae]
MTEGRIAGLTAILITSCLWGTTGTAATFAPAAGPLAIGAAALGIGGLLQAAVAVPALRDSRAALRDHLPLIVVGAVSVAVYPLAFYSSMHLAGVAVGSVVSLASAPLASAVLERFVDRRASGLGRRWALAAGLGVVGSVLLCASTFEGSAASPGSTIAGVALGLAAGSTYATYSWAVQGLIGRGLGRAASMGAVFGGGGALLLPVLFLTGAPLVASPEAFLVAAYMALIPMFLGYLLFGFGLTRVPASTATTLTLTEPAVAAVLAVLIVGERLAPLGWVGLAILGVVLVVLATAPAGRAVPAVLPARAGSAGTAGEPASAVPES